MTEIGATLNEKFLILTIGDFAQAPDQQAIAVVLNEAVPIAAPDHFDHIPARAAENGFELLNNFAVATDRPIQALQVAVDDPDQVVELLPRGQCDRSQRLGLVHLAIAQERPDLAAGAGLQPAIL